MLNSTLFFDFKKDTLTCLQCNTKEHFNEIVIYQCPSCFELNYFCNECQLTHSINNKLNRRIITNKYILVHNSIKENNYEMITKFKNRIPKRHQY